MGAYRVSTVSLVGPLASRDPTNPVKRWNAIITGNTNLAVAA